MSERMGEFVGKEGGKSSGKKILIIVKLNSGESCIGNYILIDDYSNFQYRIKSAF